jgi:hypothetical protein
MEIRGNFSSGLIGRNRNQEKTLSLARLLHLTGVILFLGSVGNLRADTLAYGAAQIDQTHSAFGVLDLNTGGFSQIAILPDSVYDLATSSNGTLYALYTPFTPNGSTFFSTAEFATINPSTGAVTNIASDSAARLDTLAFGGDGTLYGLSLNKSGSESLYSINPTTGAMSSITALSGAISSWANGAMNIRFIGNTAYTTTATDTSGLYTFSLTNGVPTSIGDTGLDMPNSLGADVNGQLVDIAAVGAGYQVFWINPATGAATSGATVDNSYVFASEPTPEPGSAILMGCGVVALCALRRRRACKGI